MRFVSDTVSQRETELTETHRLVHHDCVKLFGPKCIRMVAAAAAAVAAVAVAAVAVVAVAAAA